MVVFVHLAIKQDVKISYSRLWLDYNRSESKAEFVCLQFSKAYFRSKRTHIIFVLVELQLIRRTSFLNLTHEPFAIPSMSLHCRRSHLCEQLIIVGVKVVYEVNISIKYSTCVYAMSISGRDDWSLRDAKHKCCYMRSASRSAEYLSNLRGMNEPTGGPDQRLQNCNKITSITVQ